MKKLVMWILILLISISMITVFTLAGCKVEAVEEEAVEEEVVEEEVVEEEAVEEEAVEEEEVMEEVTINFWNTATGEPNATIYKTFIGRFMEKYPYITVNSVATETEVYVQEKLPLGLSSSNPPDVFYQWAGKTNLEFIDEGLYLDVDEAMREVMDQQAPGVFDQFTFYDKIWGAANSVKSKATMYNVDIFNQYGLEPPATLDEYRVVNQTLLDNGVTPIAFGVKDFNYGWQFWDRVVAVVAGMDKIEEMLSGPGKFGSPEQVETLRVMREFAQEGWLGDALSFNNPESQTLFFNGEAAMYGIGTWNIGPFLEVLGEAPDFKLFEYGLFPFPGPEASDTGKNIGTGGLAASYATEHPEAVKLFMQYWLSYENAMYFIETNYEPISSNVQALADSQDKLDYITILFGEILARDDLTPTTSAWGDWLCGAYYGQFLEDLQLIMFADDMTAEEGAQLLQDGYDECLASK